jgi:hypothetical protein
VERLFYRLIVIVLVPFLAGNLWANTNELEITAFEYTKQINTKLAELGQLAAAQYRSEVDNYRSDIEKYILHKKRVCRGEFSTVILNSNSGTPNVTPPRRKLSLKERKLCFREMKAIQITYINSMFQARKRYMDFLHQRRLKELSDSRELALKELQKCFNSKKRR